MLVNRTFAMREPEQREDIFGVFKELVRAFKAKDLSVKSMIR